jgi:glycosyltransferase 2 family protein
MGTGEPRKPGNGVVVVEPPQTRRVRRPIDLVRLVVVVLALLAVVGLGDVAVGTAGGLEQDLIGASSGVPHVLLQTFGVLTHVGLLVVPVATGIDLVVRSRSWQLLDALGAAGLAAGGAWLLTQLILGGRFGGVVDALTKAVQGGRTPPLDGLIVASAAFLAVADVAGRKLLRPLAILFVGSASLTGFLSGGVTGLALVASLLLGWAVGLGVRFGLGAAAVRPDGAAVAAALIGCGVDIARLELVSPTEDLRHYRGSGRSGLVDVQVVDRDSFGSMTGRRLLRRLRLRGPATRGPSLTVRAAVEHRSLMALAVHNLGMLAPEPIAACEVGPFAALVAFRPPGGTSLAQASPTDLDTDRLAAVWQMLAVLQKAKIAHRALTPEHVLLGPDGQVGLSDAGSGDIAAADVALRLDTAQLLATVALTAGVDLAVTSAVAALGPEPLIRALPLLQPIALSRSTRVALREHKQLLHDLRAQILELVLPGEPVEQVELRRLTARTLVTVVGGAVAGYVLLTQVARVNVGQVLTSADWTWALALVGFTALTITGASLVITGAVASDLRFARTYLTQLAVAFSGLVAPSAIGNIALNTRYLQRSGIEPAVAGGSVALAQLAQFCSYFVLLVLSGVLAGTSPRASFTPPALLVAALILIVAAVIVLVALPIGRRLISDRIVPLVTQVVPRVVSVFQHPRKVATLIGGALLLDLSFVAALTCATRAFGATPGVATVAVVYFAGAIVGSAVPTPGGLGGIEAALSAGLIAAGTTSSIAVSCVLLYRLSTYWLPIPFGWLSLNYLQRSGAI